MVLTPKRLPPRVPSLAIAMANAGAWRFHDWPARKFAAVEAGYSAYLKELSGGSAWRPSSPRRPQLALADGKGTLEDRCGGFGCGS